MIPPEAYRGNREGASGCDRRRQLILGVGSGKGGGSKAKAKPLKQWDKHKPAPTLEKIERRTMEEYERVRKEMAEELRTYAGKWGGLVDWGQVLIENPEYFLEKANRLLAIKGIRIESENQFYPTLDSDWQEHYATFAQFPKTIADYEEAVYRAFLQGLKSQNEGMRTAGFVKCKRREDGS